MTEDRWANLRAWAERMGGPWSGNDQAADAVLELLEEYEKLQGDHIVLITYPGDGATDAHGPMSREEAWTLAARINVAANLPTGEPVPGRTARVLWLNPERPSLMMLRDVKGAIERLFGEANE